MGSVSQEQERVEHKLFLNKWSGEYQLIWRFQTIAKFEAIRLDQPMKTGPFGSPPENPAVIFIYFTAIFFTPQVSQ